MPVIQCAPTSGAEETKNGKTWGTTALRQALHQVTEQLTGERSSQTFLSTNQLQQIYNMQPELPLKDYFGNSQSHIRGRLPVHVRAAVIGNVLVVFETRYNS
ncbi:MAG: hypothetical protein GY947_01075 [Rhodobacteraceae bacterium]|nr:hypothetical protein [Paracoccaceae bacterium]